MNNGFRILVSLTMALGLHTILNAGNNLSVSLSGAGFVYHTGDAVPLAYRVVRDTAGKHGSLSYRMTNPLNGTLLSEGTIPLKPDSSGVCDGVFSCRAAKAGSYLVRLTLDQGGDRIEKEVKFSVVTPEPDIRNADPRFGLHIHGNHTPKLTDETAWRQITDLGIKRLWYSALWNAGDPARKFVDFVNDRGLYLTAFFWMKPESCPEAYPPAQRSFYDEHKLTPIPDAEVYARKFAETVAGLKGKVKQWILFDEVDSVWGNSPAGQIPTQEIRDRLMDDYFRLVRASYLAGKKADPDCTICLCSLALLFDGYDFLENFLARGGGAYTDAIVFNFYGETYHDRELEDALPAVFTRIREIEDKLGLKKPVLIGGTGASLGTLRHDNPHAALDEEEKQAGLVARHVLVSLATGSDRFFIYTYAAGDDRGRSHSITEVPDGSPRLAYLAYANLTRLFQDAVFFNSRQPVKGVRVYSFRKPSGETIDAVWSTDGEEHILDFKAAGTVRVTDLAGTEETLNPYRNRIVLLISGSPICIRSYRKEELETTESGLSITSRAMYRGARGILGLSLSPTAPYGQATAVIGKCAEFEASPTRQLLKAGGTAVFTLKPRRILDGEQYPLMAGLCAPGTNRPFGLIRCIQEISRDPVNVTILPVIADNAHFSVAVALKNNTPKPLAGDLLLEGPGTDGTKTVINLPPANTVVQEINLDRNRVRSAENRYVATAFDKDGPVGRADKTLDFTACPRFTPTGLNPWPFPPQWVLDTKDRAGKLPAWQGPDDLSARVWTAWDEHNFYVLVQVKDNIFSQPFGNSDIWKGDSIQIAIDPTYGNRGQATLKPDGFRYQPSDKTDFWEAGLAQTPGGPIAYCWTGGRPGLIKSAVVRTQRDASGLIYQAAIPWTEICCPAPKAGDTVGFGFVINDNDGAGYRGNLEMYGGITGDKDKTLFGDLTFTNK